MKYYFECMNAFLDGHIITGIESDQEAREIAARYEATCYKLTDAGRVLIYDPRPGGSLYMTPGSRNETLIHEIRAGSGPGVKH